MRTLLLLALASVSLLAGGCAIGGAFAALEESRRRHSTHEVKAQYTGLDSKTFAVVVAADMSIMADFPNAPDLILSGVNERLREFANASGYIPSRDLLGYLYANPRWRALPRSELAKELGVSRIVWIELMEFRLTDPGNQYVWAGVAGGTISVLEADGPLPEDYVFERAVSVKFPDADGYGPDELPGGAVATTLVNRFVDRASWLFYNHQEPYYPEY